MSLPRTPVPPIGPNGPISVPRLNRPDRTGSGWGERVELSESPPDPLEDRRPDLGGSVQELVEHLIGQRQKATRCLGDGGRRSWAAIEQRDLAEELSCFDPVDEPTAALDADGALDDDEEEALAGALVRQDGPGPHLDLVGDRTKLFDAGSRDAGEQRDLFEKVLPLLQVPIAAQIQTSTGTG